MPQNPDEMIAMTELLKDLGAKSVLLKGGHLPLSNFTTDALSNGQKNALGGGSIFGWRALTHTRIAVGRH